MIEPLTSLAFSIQSNKGVYALLIGSGVSRSAGIPTGWEIVLDLIHKLAATEEEDCGDNPEIWYEDKYGEKADYSDIISKLAKTPSERTNILKPYFEPTPEEIEQGKKLPTQAHKSVAELVKQGFINIILTTNFDRLIEHALEEIGITPTIISTPDAIQGAFPVQHSDNQVIKLHGDYKDTRIKNSENELENYEDVLNKLLDRVFDEYGLIICGWSAEWDIALRNAFSRCNNHRFTTYWTTLGELGDHASQLRELRKAEIITIDSADSFFKELEEKVLAIETFRKTHPLSTKTAVATLKKLLRDEKQDIHLHDFVIDLTNTTYQNLSLKYFPTKDSPFSEENFITRVKQYESCIDILLNVIIAGCYWGNDKNTHLWVNSINRIGNPQKDSYSSNIVAWINLGYYPAQLLFYGAGISSLISNNFFTFASLFKNITVRSSTEEIPLFFYMNKNDCQPINTARAQILTENSSWVAVSEKLCSTLREYFRDYLVSDIEYQKAFDKFEYLLSLVFADRWKRLSGKGNTIWGPIGLFAVRENYEEEGQYPVKANISSYLSKEQHNLGKEWPPLKVGLFDGEVNRFEAIKAEYDGKIRESYPSIHIIL